MANRDLVGHLLNLDLLEWDKFGGSSGQEELSLGVILCAFFRQTLSHRHKLLCGDWLENFAPTSVTRISVDLNGRFDIGDSSDYTPNGYEVTKMFTSDISHSKGLGFAFTARSTGCKRLEGEGVSASQFRREDRGTNGVINTSLHGHSHILVTLFALRHDNIKDIVFEPASS